MDNEFAGCGYCFRADNHLVSVILGSYAGDWLEYQGHVVMGMTRHTRWLAPQLVCKVEYHVFIGNPEKRPRIKQPRKNIKGAVIQQRYQLFDSLSQGSVFQPLICCITV